MYMRGQPFVFRGRLRMGGGGGGCGGVEEGIRREQGNFENEYSGLEGAENK